MASIGRKEPADSPPLAREQVRTRAVPAVETGRAQGPIGRLQGQIDNIIAELGKVTWPTADETRNLTIVVIGISVTLGILLGSIDLLLSTLYQLINP